jgi:two-component SAPR family response regulator
VDLLVLTRFSNDREPPQLASSIELYRGAFLPDDDEGWVLPMREKARAWFLEAVPRHASELEQAGQLDQAARCYASAIAADDTLEPFYQGRISCYERLDRCAEASAVRHHLHQRFATSRSAASALARPSLPRSLRPS